VLTSSHLAETIRRVAPNAPSRTPRTGLWCSHVPAKASIEMAIPNHLSSSVLHHLLSSLCSIQAVLTWPQTPPSTMTTGALVASATWGTRRSTVLRYKVNSRSDLSVSASLDERDPLGLEEQEAGRSREVQLSHRRAEVREYSQFFDGQSQVAALL
jgi:hypothetical protein